jgi:uncharacterized membrane protein YfcA
MAAAAGAWLLGWLSKLAPFARYDWLGHRFDVAPIKVVVAVILLGFVLIEFWGSQKTLPVKHSSLPIGGIMSGFFGGLSGNQGAFRSAYLVRTGLSKEQFLGTGAVIACLVDLSRLAVYGATLPLRTATQEPLLLISTIVAALGGTMVAARLIHTITMATIQRLVAAMLVGIAIGLASGLI